MQPNPNLVQRQVVKVEANSIVACVVELRMALWEYDATSIWAQNK